MGIGAAQRGRFLIHQIRKCGKRAGHMLCQSVTALIHRFQQQQIQTLLYRVCLPFQIQIAKAAAGLNVRHRLMGKRHRLIQLAVLQYHQRRHHFGNAGWIILCFAVL